MAMDRVAIFIDGSNFYHALKDHFRTANVDFAALSAKLCGKDRRLLRTYYYNAAKQREDDLNGDQQRFLAALGRVPYLDVRLGRLERRETPFKRMDPDKRRQVEQTLEISLPDHYLVEKGVDVNLAIDMVEMARKDIYNVAILITGDGDFAAAVLAVKDMGKYVELAHVEGQPCRALQRACDIETVLDKAFMSGCWLPNSKRGAK